MKKLIVFISCLAIVGCANRSTEPANIGQDPQYIDENGVSMTRRSIHHYVEQLARQLFLTSRAIKLNQSVAVGTFLPMADLGGKKVPYANTPYTNVIGQQVQESFVTLATQAGMNVIEFKTTRAIKIQKDQDVMLSRRVSDLNENIAADYYLTGTYSFQERGVVVNVRLIEVDTSNVVAAATDIIPTYVVWRLSGSHQPNVTLVENKNLYHFSK